MAEETDNAQRPAPKRPRGRRRRRSAYALLVAGALWLLGYGVGWFGSAADPQQGVEGDGPGPAPSVANQDGPAQRPEGPQRQPEPDDGKAVLAAAPNGETANDRPAAREPETVRDAPERDVIPKPAGMEVDRFESLLSLVRTHLEAGEVGSAGQVLVRMRPQVDGNQAQLETLDAMVQRVAERRRSAENEILAHLRDGEVLKADLAAERLADERGWVPGAALAAVVKLGDDWLTAAARDGLPQGEALPRKRRVRLQWQEGWQEGAVAGTRPQRTTVHLRSATGQSYPTVATVAIEPVDSTQQEAVEMGLIAAHANAPRLARLWLVRALLLSKELGARGQQLRDALR